MRTNEKMASQMKPQFEWVATSICETLKVVKDQCGSALLGIKCCCFVTKTIMRDSCNFDLACIEKERKEETCFFCLVTSGFGTLYFMLLGVLLVMKT